ncbi:MAG: Stp1/IreP family PP2C-type Ser/Thr phosphatase [Halobacteriota archaeon]
MARVDDLKFAAQTDKGNRREKNEDAFRVNERLSFIAVADGVGGEPAGEIASRLAVEQIEAYLTSHIGEAAPLSILDDAVTLANDVIYQQGREDPSLEGMATTVVACLLTNERIFAAHVGDSRGYLITPHEITRLTRDHSLVAELVTSGRISPEEEREHPYRHVITRALGLEVRTNVELGSFSWNRGDYVLLCTDGLTDAIVDRAIYAVISDKAMALQSKCARLIALAKARGGFDNITVVLAEQT